MKGLISTLFVLALATVTVGAQITPSQSAGPEPSQTAKTLSEYMQPIKYDGITLNFVVINPTTAEILFQAPMKYAMRARAAQTTVLYVQGTPDKDLDFSNTFTFTQDGETVTAAPTNIKNFVTGPIKKGQRIDGYLTLAKKIDLGKPVTLKYANGSPHDVTFLKQ